jgi:hypothetical protein
MLPVPAKRSAFTSSGPEADAAALASSPTLRSSKHLHAPAAATTAGLVAGLISPRAPLLGKSHTVHMLAVEELCSSSDSSDSGSDDDGDGDEDDDPQLQHEEEPDEEWERSRSASETSPRDW